LLYNRVKRFLYLGGIMSYEKITIKNIIDKITSSDVYLPAIQRQFVWDDKQIVRFFDSLMLGYPIGTFLFWNLDKNIVNVNCNGKSSTF
jgi:uncharacterized protein with ParB-like and HNH nuclease domain